MKNLPVDQRDFILSLKRFNFKKREYPSRQLFIMVFDGKFFHGGLADRLKGIVSTFQYCYINNIEFRIKHTYPFDLSNYLPPNEYDWTLKLSDKISYHLLEVKYANFIGKSLFKRLIKLNTKKQIHCYANWNAVPELNTYYQTNYQWGELFKKLFKPTEELTNLVLDCKSKIGGPYICAVFRFQQLLGDFREYDYTELENSKKDELIEKCRQAIINLQNTSDCEKILVTSDSVLFLQNILGLEDVYTFPSKVVHIDTVEGESHNVYLKSFFDFYMLSEGIKIYSMGTDLMYKTEFPLYAAQLNNIPFERILIE
ncbi:MAG: hypothetical protein LBI82_04380 [Dysgonamonadaceae bacterium]|nr:hypothetical protein [Dysgonamonadaceae bacterium]